MAQLITDEHDLGAGPTFHPSFVGYLNEAIEELLLSTRELALGDESAVQKLRYLKSALDGVVRACSAVILQLDGKADRVFFDIAELLNAADGERA